MERLEEHFTKSATSLTRRRRIRIVERLEEHFTKESATGLTPEGSRRLAGVRSVRDPTGRKRVAVPSDPEGGHGFRLKHF